MKRERIELITNDSGDWAILKMNDEIYYENHDIPSYIWLELLESLNYEVVERCIVQEDIESGNY